MQLSPRPIPLPAALFDAVMAAEGNITLVIVVAAIVVVLGGRVVGTAVHIGKYNRQNHIPSVTTEQSAGPEHTIKRAGGLNRHAGKRWRAKYAIRLATVPSFFHSLIIGGRLLRMPRSQ